MIPVSSTVSITSVDAPHHNEFTETIGFWIEGPNKKAFTFQILTSGINGTRTYTLHAKKLFLLDAIFHSTVDLEKVGRSYGDIPHPLMTEKMGLLKDLTDQTEIYFTHLNHTNPASDSARLVQHEIEAKGFHIADENMEFTL